MEKIAVDDVEREPHPMGVNIERRLLSDALATEDVTGTIAAGHVVAKIS